MCWASDKDSTHVEVFSSTSNWEEILGKHNEEITYPIWRANCSASQQKETAKERDAFATLLLLLQPVSRIVLP